MSGGYLSGGYLSGGICPRIVMRTSMQFAPKTFGFFAVSWSIVTYYFIS